MTLQERVKAVAEFGFTERQARFLVTVMLHSGVCLLRQYSAFACIVHGQKTRKFFHKLVSRGYAKAYACRHNRGRVYHVQHKALYRAIGETDSRHRRPLSAARVAEGLIVLDAVLASRDVTWLTTDLERQAHLPTSSMAGVSVGFRVPANVRIGVDQAGRWMLVCVVSDARLESLRAALYRCSWVLASVPTWTLRLVLPPTLAPMSAACQEVFREDLATPIRDEVIEHLGWYFSQRRVSANRAVQGDDEETYRVARHAFGAPRFEALYKHWLTDETALDVASSRTIADAIQRGSGRVECQVLPHQYRHLSLVSTAAEGAEEGHEGTTRPRPRVPIWNRPADREIASLSHAVV